MHDARYLSQAEIDSLDPEPLPRPGSDPLARAREAITASGHWNAGQQFGQRWPIGCVALEITQRCNLDCTLCYLSENSEAVRDIPIEEIHRRIDLIHQHYGPGTDVQVTGGEPTLRARADLVEIIQAIAARGMRSTLMTNGVHASRELLEALSAAGLSDVAFHVDTTQEIKGFDCEAALNQRRLQYIERARGLPLGVFFNTTVHRDNFHEVAGLAAFFAEHAAAVRTASFQLQADTGRGVAGRRDVVITPDTVTREIERGIGSALRFDASLVGHPACTRYAKCLVLGGEALDLFDEPAFIRRVQSATAHLRFDRRRPATVVWSLAGWLCTHPRLWGAALRWLARKGWQARGALTRWRAPRGTVSFVVHNFMDAARLEPDRIAACVFKTMTRDGPISMCLHNAKRDQFILQSIEVAVPNPPKSAESPKSPHAANRFWQPLTGEVTAEPGAVLEVDPQRHPLKRLRGRSRQVAMAGRRAGSRRVPASTRSPGGR